jgi:transcriptional regulator with XRE-family HTH domain
VSRRKIQSNETFGQRLARLRKARGFTQAALGKKIGLSYRMISYYEGETDRPPAHVLPQLAQALGVRVDELLGVAQLPEEPPIADIRLWRRMQRITALPPAKRRAVFQVIDALLDQKSE